MGFLPQHKKLAMTGLLGQEIPDGKAGATGKPTDQKSKSAPPAIKDKGGRGDAPERPNY
jgi:hypothetical protein